MRALVSALALVCFVSVGAAQAAKPTRGYAIVGGDRMPVRYAAAFTRAAENGEGGYGIVLSDRPLRCDRLHGLPTTNPLGQRWALVALFPTKDGFPVTGSALGQMDYPVADAYAALTRGVSINLVSAAPVPGYVWRGRVDQSGRRVDGKLYAVHAVFAARWCG